MATIISVRTFGRSPVVSATVEGKKVLAVYRQLVNPQALYDDIRAVAGGTFFTVEFTKRTNGEKRVMNARLGVTQHLAGGDLAFDPKRKALLPVWDVQKRAYRSISLDSLNWIKVRGETIYFV